MKSNGVAGGAKRAAGAQSPSRTACKPMGNLCITIAVARSERTPLLAPGRAAGAPALPCTAVSTPVLIVAYADAGEQLEEELHAAASPSSVERERLLACLRSSEERLVSWTLLR